jgi:hypothetical protein
VKGSYTDKLSNTSLTRCLMIAVLVISTKSSIDVYHAHITVILEHSSGVVAVEVVVVVVVVVVVGEDSCSDP